MRRAPALLGLPCAHLQPARLPRPARLLPCRPTTSSTSAAAAALAGHRAQRRAARTRFGATADFTDRLLRDCRPCARPCWPLPTLPSSVCCAVETNPPRRCPQKLSRTIRCFRCECPRLRCPSPPMRSHVQMKIGITAGRGMLKGQKTGWLSWRRELWGLPMRLHVTGHSANV